MHKPSLNWALTVTYLVVVLLGLVECKGLMGVFFPGTSEILYQDLTVNKLNTFYTLTNFTGPNALAVDTDGVLSNNISKIYFSVSTPTGAIYRCNILDRCSGLEKIYDSGASQTISGISLDFTNSKMFWVESSTVKKSNPDGLSVSTLLTALEAPNKITVDTASGFLYVALSSKNNGNTPGQGVGKSTLSGSGFTTILASNLQNAQGVTFDPLNNTLYVADSSKDSGATTSDGNEKILHSNQTGGASATVTNGNMAKPTAVSLYINQTASAKVLYWIDSAMKTVSSYDLESGERTVVFSFTQTGGSDLALHVADLPLNFTVDNYTTTGNDDKGDRNVAALGTMIAAIIIPVSCVLCVGAAATGVVIRKKKHSGERDVEKVDTNSVQSTASLATLQGGVSARSKESNYDDLAMQSKRNTTVEQQTSVVSTTSTNRTLEMRMEPFLTGSDLSLPGANFSNTNDIFIGSASHSNSNVELPGNSNENSSESTHGRAVTKSRSGYLYSSKTKNAYEIDPEELSFGKELGRGAYGVVYLGEYRHQKCAIKKLLRTDLSTHQIEEFKEEGLLMAALPPHKNVVTTLGVCVSKELCIVTEYLPMGSLLAYLKHAKMDMKRVLKIGKDIAAGMAHLAREGIVHRDLAARNLLMTESLEIKISDFGMARVLENEDENSGKTESTTGPLKWMAPECISQRQYSTKSDVWAFGITMIEILTKEIPYPGESPVTVCIKVVNGHKHQIPETCPVALASLIDQCWAFEPQKRPDFDSIFTTLEKMKL